jgi:hypothetical protein
MDLFGIVEHALYESDETWEEACTVVESGNCNGPVINFPESTFQSVLESGIFDDDNPPPPNFVKEFSDIYWQVVLAHESEIKEYLNEAPVPMRNGMIDYDRW